MKSTDLSAQFVKSINGTDAMLYDGMPQVACIGRSNVGKSSLINSLLGKKLARSSSNPGKTVSLDFFYVKDANHAFYMVDLPGYGFANVSKRRQDDFKKRIWWYMFSSGVFHALVVLIVDAKVGMTAFDKEMLTVLRQYAIPFVVVANKIDRLSGNDRIRALSTVYDSVNQIDVVVYSAKTMEGRGELKKRVFRAVEKKGRAA